MHDTALAIGEQFFRLYARSSTPTIVEFGSMNVNGSLRDVAPKDATYVGLDLEAGPGVDVVVSPGQPVPVCSGYADLVVSSSALEHDALFWTTFEVMCRICKPGGYIYINVPSNGFVHAYPLDCWRFYPDAGIALETFSTRGHHPVTLIESFVAERREDFWNDFVAVFQRGGADPDDRERLHPLFPVRNVYDLRSKDRLHVDHRSEDQRLLDNLRLERRQLIASHVERERVLRTDVARLQQEAALARQEGDSARADADDRQAALTEQQARTASLGTEAAQYRDRATELAAEVESLEAGLASERTERAGQFARLRQDADEARQQAARTAAEADRLSAALLEQQKRATSLEAEVRVNRARAREMEMRIEGLEGQLTELRQVAEAMSADSTELKHALERSCEEAEKLHADLVVQVDAVARTEADLRHTRENLAQALSEGATQRSNILELEADITLLRAAHVDWMRWKRMLEQSRAYRIDRALARWLKVSPLGISGSLPRLADTRSSQGDDST